MIKNLHSKLENSLGKSIDQICPNKFHSFSSNHCAHFVSHMTGLTFSFNCKEFKGGNKQGGNIRVHEVFEKCAKVGKFKNAPLNNPILVFVTRNNVVNLARKTMANIPQKHIGIFIDGFIYHYSNSQEKVVKWKPQKFIDIFESIYSGKQGLFYGTIPGSDLRLHIDASGENIPQGIAFKLSKSGNKWHAKTTNSNDNDKFYIGREINNKAKKFHGIFQKTSEYSGPKFDPEKYINDIDHWAYLLYATGYCESKNYFNLFNTYDRAKFTYGFYQLAAHTPNDNLILYFRRLVQLPRAKEYFPELSMVDGKLQRVHANGGNTNLEEIMRSGRNNSKQLQLFMNYLNPNRKKIDNQEVLQVARLMHATVNEPTVRKLQVEIANEILQNKMAKRYNKWYSLDGASDIICTIIADIHHQGRAKKSKVITALQTDNPEDALITISPKYPNRVNNLRHIVNELKDAGKLGNKVYDAANNEFI